MNAVKQIRAKATAGTTGQHANSTGAEDTLFHTISFILSCIYIMMYVLIYNPLYTFIDTYLSMILPCYDHIIDKHFDN